MCSSDLDYILASAPIIINSQTDAVSQESGVQAQVHLCGHFRFQVCIRDLCPHNAGYCHVRQTAIVISAIIGRETAVAGNTIFGTELQTVTKILGASAFAGTKTPAALKFPSKGATTDCVETPVNCPHCGQK